VIADRHPFVVGHERLVGAEHRPDVQGVIDRGVEVAVIANPRGELHRDVALGNQHGGNVGRDLPGEQRVERHPEPAPGVRAEPHQVVERRSPAGGDDFLSQVVEKARTGKRSGG
jgi:hypothetical protein